jgi:hypothetical protein
MEAQKRLADDNLVAISQGLTNTGHQALATIQERAIGRAKIFDEILAFSQDYTSVPARNLGLWVVGVQVNVRKNTAVGIPTTDLSL